MTRVIKDQDGEETHDSTGRGEGVVGGQSTGRPAGRAGDGPGGDRAGPQQGGGASPVTAAHPSTAVDDGFQSQADTTRHRAVDTAAGEPFMARSPVVALAVSWWNGLCPDIGITPERLKEDIPGAIRASVVLFDVVDGGADFRIALIGERVSRHTRPGKLGRLVSELFGRIGDSAVADALAAAARTGAPQLAWIDYVGPRADIAYTANLVLPVVGADGRVRQVLSIVDFVAADRPVVEELSGAGVASLAHRLPSRAGIVAITLLIAFAVAAFAVHGALTSVHDERLVRRVTELERSLAFTLSGVERSLAKLGDLVVDAGPISVDRFNDIADALLGNQPGTAAVRAAALIPALPVDGGRTFAELAAQMVPLAGQAVFPWPETTRTVRYPALLVWPDPTNRWVLGYDLWTDPSRRAAAQRSLAIGRPSASAPVVLTQDSAVDAGSAPVSTLMIHDAPGIVTLAVGEGGDRVPVNAVVAIGITLSQAIADGLLGDLEGLEVVVLDVGPTALSADDAVPSATALMVHPPMAALDRIGPQDRTTRLTFAGRWIELRARDADAAARNLPFQVAAALMALGTILSATVGLYLRQIENHRRMLETEVAGRTKQIRSLNQDLINKVNHAVSADTAKSRLLASLSHELRTPLNGIIGFTDLLRQRFDALSEDRRRRYLDHVAEAGDHMRQVVTRFLELSQGTPRFDALCFERVALGPFGETLQAMAEPLAMRYAVDLVIDLTLDPPVAVRADVVALRQCLLNFIDNAIKFTPEGGRVAVTVRRTQAGLRIAVADTGIGMNDVQLANLDDSQTDARGVPINGPQGLGLGLTLSRGLLAMMDFEMAVRSARRQGTTVEVTVPEAAVYPVDPPAR